MLNYDQNETRFSIWAPTATSVKLYLNNNVFLLKRHINGVWQEVVHGDWHGFSYNYKVVVDGKASFVNDPYAKAMTANSAKSVIVNLAKMNTPHINESKRPRLQHLQDAIIYELHVRDATIHDGSGVANRGTFLGLTETDTKTANGFSTALSYIKELGCTHVQLLPINDFARVNESNPKDDYNWGYDPLYFQVARR